MSRLLASVQYRARTDGDTELLLEGARMSSRHKTFCSVLQIFLVVLSMLIAGSVIFAQEPETANNGKEKSFPISTAVAMIPPVQESLIVTFGAGTGEERKEGTSSYYYLYGWAFINDQETIGQKVYVQFEKPDGTIVHYSTMPCERADIRDYFKNELYYASGFNAKIPLKNISDIDACTIRFIVKNKSGTYKSGVWKFGVSSRVEIELQQQESHEVIFNVGTSEERKEGASSYYFLSGWIYIIDQEPVGQKVYVQFEKPNGTVVLYSTWPTERPDIGAYFKNELYNASGFSASIPLKDISDINACTIRFVVKNKNGIFLSLVWKTETKADSRVEKFSVFVVVNWFLVILTFIILFLAIWRDRSLLIKPSIMAILFFHLMCQWGSVLWSGRIESILPQPWVFVLLSHGFPLIGLIVSLFIVRKSARQLWGRMTVNSPSDPTRRMWAWAILAVCLAGFVIVYLNYVPFRSTGLYKIFTSPLESDLARDQSMKFLANPFLRYGYSIMMAVFAPLLVVLTLQLFLMQVRRRKWLPAFFYSICLGGVLVVSSLSGARAYPAYIILAIVFALLLRKGFPLNPIYLISGVLLVLILPTVLTLLREGKVVTAKSFIEYFRGSTYQRVVIIPMEAGLQHVEYAQTHDFFGIQAIPKLAGVLGVKPLNVPNFIGKMYSGDPQTTQTTNTSYIYAYYSYFGLIAFIPCLIGLWLLDLSLLVYRKLSDNMLLPCIACISIATNTFSQTEYTISLFSQGFLLLLLVSWAVDRAVLKIESVTKK